MKSKLLLFAICSAVCGSFFAGCGNKKSAEELAAEEAHRADSIAAAQAAEQARLDSINRAESEKMYAEALTLVPGKMKILWYTDNEGGAAILPVTITNNTDIPFSAADYTIGYTREYAVCSDGSEPNKFQNKTGKTQDIAPGSSVTITLREEFSENIHNPNVKLNISAEDFAARRAEANGK